MVEDLKAKLHEVLQDRGEYTSPYTPSFARYKICHSESIAASVNLMTPVNPDPCLVTTRLIQEFSTTVYNEVCLLHVQCPSSINVVSMPLCWHVGPYKTFEFAHVYMHLMFASSQC